MVKDLVPTIMNAESALMQNAMDSNIKREVEDERAEVSALVSDAANGQDPAVFITEGIDQNEQP